MREKKSSGFFADTLGPIPKGGFKVETNTLVKKQINDDSLIELHRAAELEALLAGFSEAEKGWYERVLPRARELTRRTIDAMTEPMTDFRLDFPLEVPPAVVRAISEQILAEFSFEMLTKNQMLVAAKKAKTAGEETPPRKTN